MAHQQHPPTPQLPILYSFRRCPYAMRARMALLISGQSVLVREVVLRDKPAAMLAISPKATVPVLVLPSALNDDSDEASDKPLVLEESMEIMEWALHQSDPHNWLGTDNQQAAMKTLISDTQTRFKDHLDRYKYPNRYEDVDPLVHRAQALTFVQELEALLNARPEADGYLFGDQPMLADIAIFPFIRQFANTDRTWFDAEATLKHVKHWLNQCLALPLFDHAMTKYPQWHEGDDEPVLNL